MLEDDNSQAALLRARGVLPASSEHGFFTKIWGQGMNVCTYQVVYWQFSLWMKALHDENSLFISSRMVDHLSIYSNI